MLGRNWRIHCFNGTGVNVDFDVQARQWKFDSSGALTFSAESEVANLTIAASGYDEGSGVDNSTNLYIGADFEVVITPSASATGSVAVYIQRSTDGGTTWPSDGVGDPIAGNYFSASSTAVTLQESA